MEVRFLGHAGFELADGGDTTVLIDPFLSGNPKAAISADDAAATTILLTHGHGDHIGDTAAIAKRTGATTVAIVEIANELGEEGIDVRDPNMGGTVKFDWGWVKLTPAWHTAVTPSGTPHTPAGLLIGLGGKTIYHLGDTALFSDLKLVAHRGDQIDVALMCIGGHYTM
ncbi:MAG TPA: metal-dependent hydrolase, partial [Solirubrobacteraceae bacterium]|nr:metal-dependent hydrolase [Solirubrobacteraceae bacterium]